MIGSCALALAAEARAHDHGKRRWASSLVTLAEGALLLPDLGSFHRSFPSVPASAQAWFDQGLRLAYGFNHDEAARSFARGATIEPSCTMCYWGVALTLGPNYNAPMLPDRARVAWDALGRARALAKEGAPVERALVEALGTRYAGPQATSPADRLPYDEAYGEAMAEVARRYPADADVQVLYAEALMDVHPWKLWSLDGVAAPGTDELVRAIEAALRLAPDHPGANHYLLHALEASPHPERAEAAADKLPSLMPGAGHVAHMPAHIYQRTGRYADASAANLRAIAADEAYLARTRPPGYYGMYLGHNFGFLAYSSSMIGRSAESISAAKRAVQAVPLHMLDMMPGMDFFAGETTLARVRFGRWRELLDEPAPPRRYVVLTALHLHGRGMALASLGRLPEAGRAADALDALTARYPAALGAGSGVNTARQIAAVASAAVRGRIAERRGAPDEAIARYAAAVALEDQLAYNEPADWFYPLRHLLGAALLDADRAAEAEAVYAEDLRRNPGNGWALFGRARALEKLGRASDAAKVRAEFDRAWSGADITLERSAF